MSFYVTNSYATVWSVKQEERKTSGYISTSDKDKDGNRQYSSWNAVFFGTAKEKAEEVAKILDAYKRDNVRKGVNIKIAKGKVTNPEYGEPDENGHKKRWLSALIYDFDVTDSSIMSPSETTVVKSAPDPVAASDPEEDLPF